MPSSRTIDGDFKKQMQNQKGYGDTDGTKKINFQDNKIWVDHQDKWIKDYKRTKSVATGRTRDN